MDIIYTIRKLDLYGRPPSYAKPILGFVYLVRIWLVDLFDEFEKKPKTMEFDSFSVQNHQKL